MISHEQNSSWIFLLNNINRQWLARPFATDAWDLGHSWEIVWLIVWARGPHLVTVSRGPPAWTYSSYETTVKLHLFLVHHISPGQINSNAVFPSQNFTSKRRKLKIMILLDEWLTYISDLVQNASLLDSISLRNSLSSENSRPLWIASLKQLFLNCFDGHMALFYVFKKRELKRVKFLCFDIRNYINSYRMKTMARKRTPMCYFPFPINNILSKTWTFSVNTLAWWVIILRFWYRMISFDIQFPWYFSAFSKIFVFSNSYEYLKVCSTYLQNIKILIFL